MSIMKENSLIISIYWIQTQIRVKDVLTALDSKLRQAKFKKPNEIHKFVRAGKFEGEVKLFIKAKTIQKSVKPSQILHQRK